MKKKERLLLLSLLIGLLWLTGCASEEYISVNPDVFNFEFTTLSNDVPNNSYYYDWKDHEQLMGFVNFLNFEMEQKWDTDRLVLPYGSLFIEFRKITDYGLIVLSSILVDSP